MDNIIELLKTKQYNYNFWFLLAHGREVIIGPFNDEVEWVNKTGEQDEQNDRILSVGNKFYCISGHGSSWDDWQSYGDIYEVKPVDKQITVREWHKV